MLGAIRQAKEEIFFETFIWKSDAIGQSFKRALIEAADRGVAGLRRVRRLRQPRRAAAVLHLPPNIRVRRHPVIASGFRLPAQHRPRPPQAPGRRPRRRLRRRLQHRLAVRDRLARHPRPADRRHRLGHAQRLHRLLEPVPGPRRARRCPTRGSVHWQPEIRVHRNIPRNAVYPIRGMYLEAIDRASHHIYLTHAYLIPDADMLSRADPGGPPGGRRPDHRAGRSNHIVADWLSRGYYGQLLRGGVRLFLYQDAMVHAKTATIDGQWSTIGTANIDRLSLFGNYEINIEVFSPDVARQMQEIFAIDSSNTVELGLAEWRAARDGEVLRDGADPAAAPALSSVNAPHTRPRAAPARCHGTRDSALVRPRRSPRPRLGGGALPSPGPLGRDGQPDRGDQQDGAVDGEPGRRLHLEGLQQGAGVGQQDDAADGDTQQVGRGVTAPAPRRAARRSDRRPAGPARSPS